MPQSHPPSPTSKARPADADVATAAARIAHQNAVLRAIHEVRKVTRGRDAQRFSQDVCESLTHSGGYASAWLVLFDARHLPVRTGAAGLGPAFAAAAEQWCAGRLPSCWHALLAHDSVLASTAPREFCGDNPLAEQYAQRGALLTRLAHDGTVYGLLCVGTDVAWVHDPEEVQLFREVAQDISYALRTLEIEDDHRRTVANLRENVHLLQSFLDRTEAIVFAKDDQGRYLMVNRCFEALVGRTRQEIVGQTDRALFPAQAVDEFTANDRRVLSSGEPLECEETLELADGLHVYRVLKVPMHGVFTSGAAVCGFATDITARRRAEEAARGLEAQLRQAQKMEAIGQLAGGIAHDFNNLLTAILGNVELLHEKVAQHDPADELMTRSLEQIELAGQRAAALTRQLLAFSRRQMLKREVLDLNRLLHSMEAALRQILGADIQFELELDPALPPICADGSQLEQVILNLVVNARDAMPAAGRLRVRSARQQSDGAAGCRDGRPGGCVALSISDTGHGITPDARERIFEPFFTTKPPGKGTGLGLSTVYGIVRQLEGHITVDSTPGEGTTFTILLPAAEPPAAPAPSVRSGTGSPLGTETILVCEDDENVRQLATRFLESAGYTVLPAECAASATTLAGHAPKIDLLLTDVVLPDSNGRNVAATAEGLHPDIRTLYISGFATDVIATDGVLDDGIEFLEKPFTRQALLRRVRELLDRPGRRTTP